ncbi:hypothetical protein HK405_007112, partial [Cladochytrium tenue]
GQKSLTTTGPITPVHVSFTDEAAALGLHKSTEDDESNGYSSAEDSEVEDLELGEEITVSLPVSLPTEDEMDPLAEAEVLYYSESSDDETDTTSEASTDDELFSEDLHDIEANPEALDAEFRYLFGANHTVVAAAAIMAAVAAGLSKDSNLNLASILRPSPRSTDPVRMEDLVDTAAFGTSSDEDDSFPSFGTPGLPGEKSEAVDSKAVDSTFFATPGSASDDLQRWSRVSIGTFRRLQRQASGSAGASRRDLAHALRPAVRARIGQRLRAGAGTTGYPASPLAPRGGHGSPEGDLLLLIPGSNSPLSPPYATTSAPPHRQPQSLRLVSPPTPRAPQGRRFSIAHASARPPSPPPSWPADDAGAWPEILGDTELGGLAGGSSTFGHETRALHATDDDWLVLPSSLFGGQPGSSGGSVEGGGAPKRKERDSGRGGGGRRGSVVEAGQGVRWKKPRGAD